MMSAMASVASAHDGAEIRRVEILPPGSTIWQLADGAAARAGRDDRAEGGAGRVVVEVDAARAGGDPRGQLLARRAVGEGVDLQPRAAVAGSPAAAATPSGPPGTSSSATAPTKEMTRAERTSQRC